MRIILLGPPGAGKGTQAATISAELGHAHISSGDLFREEQEKESELGLLAKQYMEKGELVPNEVTIGMILGRINRDDCNSGFILDGFPRNLDQAKALDTALAETSTSPIDSAIFIDVSRNELMIRLGGRWVCRTQQHPYHVTNSPPKLPGKCDIDGSELYQRSDDSEETARRRLEVYFEQTAPLITYYTDNGRLTTIDGERPIDQVGKELISVLQ